MAADARAVVVRHLRHERDEITDEHVLGVFRELFPGFTALPLCPERFELVIDGVPTAVANALRRTLIDEMPGHRLTVPREGYICDDEYMIYQYVVTYRMMLIPLRPNISPEAIETLRFSLHVTNTGASNRDIFSGDLCVSSGEMGVPVFNPTIVIATLRPGKRLDIEGVRIIEGLGRLHESFQVATRVAAVPLDAPEFTAAEVALADAAFDRTDGGVVPATRAPSADELLADSDWSGYRTPSMLADPRRHRITGTLPAAPPPGRGAPPMTASRSVITRACATIADRLRLILTNLRDDERRAAALVVTPYSLGGGRLQGQLTILREGHTIGHLLARAISDLIPDVTSVAYTYAEHTDALRVTVVHVADTERDIAAVIGRAVEYCIGVFAEIQRGVLHAAS